MPNADRLSGNGLLACGAPWSNHRGSRSQEKTVELLGAIEAGGTKFLCAIGTGDGAVLKQSKEIDTGTPAETLANVVEWFRAQPETAAVAAIGIASFGPIDLRRGSPHYGEITSTPKPNWQNTKIVGRIEDALGKPVAFDTDVNGAALGEYHWGRARQAGTDTFVYITVGTGIGGGGMMGGRLMHGLIHPEMGHMHIPHDPRDHAIGGYCPSHFDCWEGLASGFAIEKRWGRKAADLEPGHKAWILEAHYLALGIVNLICVLSCELIILGGGVMKQSALFPMIHDEVRTLLHGYIRSDRLCRENISGYIVPASENAGIRGALALARTAAAEHRPR
jgi:fructokinase